MRTKAILLTLTMVALTVGTAGADEGEATEDPLWTGNLGLAYLSTTGNSDTTTFGLDLELVRRPTPWGMELEATTHRAEEDGELTAERYAVQGRATRALGERWQLFAGVGGEKDEFAGYELQTYIDGGGTYAMVVTPTHDLSLDVGLRWTDEDRIEPESDVDFLSALVGAKYTWTMSDTSSLSQDVMVVPNLDESSDWRLSSLTALEAAINSRFAVKLSYEVRYRNEPVDELDGTDTSTKVSLVVKL